MIIESYAPGTPSWVDLMTSDQDSAIDFYANLFGWEVEKAGPEMGNYAMCMKDGSPVAGIGTIPDDQNFPPSWTMYISVDNVDQAVAKAQAAGGQVYVPVMDVAGEGMHPGRMAVLAEPSGGVFGLWEPHDHKGSGIANEPGSFAWNELLSRDPATSRKFLGAVFGYEWEAMAGMDEMEYYTAKLNDHGVAGVMAVPPQVPAEAPSHWMTYFAVGNAEESVAQAVATGGTVMQPVFDTPFGQIAVLSDPQGAIFCIVQMPSQ